MKKLFLLLTFVFVALLSKAQEENKKCQFIVHELIADMKGFIKGETELKDGTIATTVEVPSFFDKEVVAMKIYTPIKIYSDVSMESNWKQKPNFEKTYQCTLNVAGEPLDIIYMEEFQHIVFFYNKEL